VLAEETTVAQVAATHVEALDAQIRTLRLRRAVLATVAKRRSSTEEMALMNNLARLSAQQRKQIIDDFVDEVFRGLDPDPGLQAHLWQATPELPEDPTPEQVDAWVELAELVQDPDFRRRIRTMAEYGAQARAAGGLLGYGIQGMQTVDFVRRVVEHAGAARERGVAPQSAEGAAVLDRILAGTPNDQRRPELLAQLEAGIDARAERYWQLVGVINGWPPHAALVPTFEWMIAALRAHG